MDLFKPAVCFLQECKMKRKGQIKLPDYEIFELLRTNSAGDGLLTIAYVNIEPVLIADNFDQKY